MTDWPGGAMLFNYLNKEQMKIKKNYFICYIKTLKVVLAQYCCWPVTQFVINYKKGFVSIQSF